MRCVNVVIADRHPVVLQGLTNLLGAGSGFKVVSSSSDGASCIEAIRRLVPDIAIFDISMPGLTGLEILAIANSENLPYPADSFHRIFRRPRTCHGGRSRRLRCHFERCDARNSRAVLARGRGWPEAVAAIFLRSGCVPGARKHRDCGERADGADRPGAPDHASGVRRIVEQRNWAQIERCRRHYQSSSSSHFSEA